MAIHWGESFDDYCRAEAFSFHKGLAFEKSEALYRKCYVDKSLPRRKETEAFLVGHAAHTLILEGPAEFAARYVTRPATYECADGKDKGKVKPFNLNATVCSEWVASQKAMGRSVLAPDDALLVYDLAAAALNNPDAAALLKRGRPEVTIRQECPSLGMTIQGRIDWLTPDNVIVDLKTIQDLDDLDRDIERRSYYRQCAFYKFLLEAEVPEVGDVYIIAVEKDEPKRCAVRKISPLLLEIGAAENQAMLMRIAECYATGVWTGDPVTKEIGPSEWLLKRAFPDGAVKLG